MTPLAISKIRSNYAALAADAEGLGADFSARLFALAPSLRSLVPSGSREEGAVLVAMLDRLVRSLDRLEEMSKEIEALRCSFRGVSWPSSGHLAVGEALLDTLEARLSSEFDDEARAAWATAFVIVADMGMHSSEAGSARRVPPPSLG